MQCANCETPAAGTTAVHVCSAECAQQIGARFRSRKTVEKGEREGGMIIADGTDIVLPPGLWVQGDRRDEWVRATDMQQKLYQQAKEVIQRATTDGNLARFEMTPLASGNLPTKPGQRVTQQESVMHQAGGLYLYVTDSGMNTGRNLVGATKRLFWEQPAVLRPPLHGGSLAIALPNKPRK